MKNLPAGAWLSQIEGARSTADVVRILRDYLSAMDDGARSQMPVGLTPENIRDVSDVQTWAVTLAHHDLKAGGPVGSEEALHQAALVFAAAGAKLPKLGD